MPCCKSGWKATSNNTFCILFGVLSIGIWCNYFIYHTAVNHSIYHISAQLQMQNSNINSSIRSILSIENCNVYTWKIPKLRVINCTGTGTHNSMRTDLTFAVASFHDYDNQSFSFNEKIILSNHINYTIKHNYIYFDVNALLFNDSNISQYFEEQSQTKHAMYKAQKVFIIHSILTDPIFGNAIDYILWIDFDAIFYNCSVSIQQILHYTQQIYSKQINNSMDIIFAKDFGEKDLLNAGSILYKNTKWTKQLLFKQMHVFKNANKFKFVDIINKVDLVDQCLWSVLLMDPIYNPLQYNETMNNWDIGAESLRKQLFLNRQKLKQETPDSLTRKKQTNDAIYSMFIHDRYLGSDIKWHSAIIPQLYINMLYNQYKWTEKHKSASKANGIMPFIMHFNGERKKNKMKIFMNHHSDSLLC